MSLLKVVGVDVDSHGLVNMGFHKIIEIVLGADIWRSECARGCEDLGDDIP